MSESRRVSLLDVVHRAHQRILENDEACLADGRQKQCPGNPACPAPAPLNFSHCPERAASRCGTASPAEESHDSGLVSPSGLSTVSSEQDPDGRPGPRPPSPATLSLLQRAQQQQHLELLHRLGHLPFVARTPTRSTRADVSSPAPPPTPAALDPGWPRQSYADFREDFLRRREAASEGAPGPGASREPDDRDSYRERRRKNNLSAKRSRDARKAKELDTAIRAQYLERENVQLKLELSHLRAENAQLVSQYRQMQLCGKL